jgi:chromosome partitioning protein
MVRTLAWCSEKGGVGKTSLCLNTAHALAKRNPKKRVLVVDADPQANATLVLLKGQTPELPTLYHVMCDQADAGDTIRETSIPGLDVMPGDTLLADANLSLASEYGRERRLKLAMRDVADRYAYVIFDTSPQRTLININVLNYVREVWCPIDPGVFSLAGLVKLQAALSEVSKFLDNSELRLAGLVLNEVRSDRLCKDIETEARSAFGRLICRTTIPANVAIGEAHAHYQSVLEYAPRSPGAHAYQALTREIESYGKANRTGRIAVDGAAPSDRTRRSARRRKAG